MRSELEVLQQRLDVEPLAHERERARLVAKPVDVGSVVACEHGEASAGRGAHQIVEVLGCVGEPLVDAFVFAALALLGELRARLLHEGLELDAVALVAGSTAVRGQVERYEGRLDLLVERRIEVRQNRDVVVHGKPLFSGDRSECRRSATGRSSIAAVPPASDTAAVLSGFGWHPADCPAPSRRGAASARLRYTGR